MREAVCAIFRFREKVFSIRRQNYLSTFPGYTAFPGGKVDKKDDTSLAVLENTLVKDISPILVEALKREMQEELNYDLGLAIEKGDVKSFYELGVAVTPEFNPYRFKTHFFVVELSEEFDFELDDEEASSGSWTSPSELLGSYQRAEILAVPPIVSILEVLDKDINQKELVDLNLKYDDENQVPMIESIYGVKQFIPLSNTFPPANRTNCFLIGQKNRAVLIDPSPKNLEEYDKLLVTLNTYNIDEIFLTHHHPDHHEYAPKLARELSISIGLSVDSEERIKKKWGGDYFKDIIIKNYQEGDILTRSLNQDILIYAVPGHDEGQLALAPRNLNWFLVGDLIQSVGTVVVGGEEGNMQKYFSSLKKVISLSPKFIIPSHGIALGGTHKLEVTLKHRERREQEIKELLNKGYSRHEILGVIYEGLDPKLELYALATIDSHIDKIRAEVR